MNRINVCELISVPDKECLRCAFVYLQKPCPTVGTVTKFAFVRLFDFNDFSSHYFIHCVERSFKNFKWGYDDVIDWMFENW